MPARRHFDAHVKRFVAARQGWKCAACGELLDAAFHVDHVVPLWQGGDDHVDNAQALCTADHARKTQREEMERLARARQRARVKRPSLACMQCGRVVSPYFTHTCDR